MAFNSITSPLTLANAQATYSGFKTPNTYSSQNASAVPVPNPSPTNDKQPTFTGLTYDPIAEAAARAAAQARTDYDAAKTNTYSSINDVIGDTGSKLNSSILDYLDSLKSGQRAIDQKAVQNEMSRESGRLGVVDAVGSGIRNAGVMLSAKGATSSSAADEIAKLYSQFGRKQLSNVGNQYELGNQDVANAQEDLGMDTAQFQRHYEEQKNSAVNTIVQDASSKLAALNAAAQNASLADRIDIESQKAAIRNQALNALAGYDNSLREGVSSVSAASTDTNRAKAKSALIAGTAPENAFDYTTRVPAGLQGTGPFSSPLQVFSPPKRQDELSVGV